MYRATGQTDFITPPPETAVNWCENAPAKCIDPAEYQKVVAKAKFECAKRKPGQVRGLFGLGKICSADFMKDPVSLATFYRYDPCLIAQMPACTYIEPPMVPIVPDGPRAGDPPPSEDDDEDNTMYMVGGILMAVLLVGGGYAVFKNRKKKKGKKK